METTRDGAFGVVVRDPIDDDAARCADIHVTSWRETYGDLLPPSFWEEWTVASATARWRTWIASEQPPVVAEVEGEVVGFSYARAARATGVFDPVRERELAMLYVLSGWHGAGIGQALLDAVLDPGAAAQLWVAERNPRAIRFYERNGFRPDGARDEVSNQGLVAIRLVR